MSTLAGETIYIEQDSDWVNAPRFAALDVLDSTATILHYLSTPSRHRSITGTIHDQSGGTAPQTYTDLVTAARAATAVNLTTEQGSQGNVYILDITGQRVDNTAGASAAKKYVIRFSVELMQA